MVLLLADLDYFAGLERFVSRAALGIKKSQEFLQRASIRRVPQECTFPLNAYQAFVLEFVEMMGQR